MSGRAGLPAERVRMALASLSPTPVSVTTPMTKPVQAQAVALEEHQAWLAGMAGVVHHGEVGVSIALQLLANIGSGVGGKHLLQVVGRGATGEGNEQAGKWQSGHGGDRGGWVLPS